MNATTRARWMGVGSSDDPDSRAASHAAVSTALGGRDAALVIVFAAPGYDMDVVARETAAAAPHTTVVGCSTAGEIADGLAGSGRVVAVAIGGPGFEARAAIGSLADGAAEAGRAAAAGLAHLEGASRTLMLLSDGLAGHHSAIVRGAYSAGGAGVRLVGGSAGDGLAMKGTWQFFDGAAHTGAVVGVAIASEGPIGIGVGHGWRRRGEPMVITESDGQWIYRIDDQPALDYYLAQLDIPFAPPPEEVDWAAVTLLRPFGLPRGDEDEVRAVLGIDLEKKALHCSDAPQGAILYLMEGDRESVLEGTERACAEAVADLHGAPVAGLIAFDCAARRAVLGERGLVTEMELITRSAPGAPLAGFYTYGEVARRSGSRGVHSATLVVMAIG